MIFNVYNINITPVKIVKYLSSELMSEANYFGFSFLDIRYLIVYRLFGNNLLNYCILKKFGMKGFLERYCDSRYTIYMYNVKATITKKIFFFFYWDWLHRLSTMTFFQPHQWHAFSINLNYLITTFKTIQYVTSNHKNKFIIHN